MKMLPFYRPELVVSKDESRYNLHDPFLDTSAVTPLLVATDGRRLVALPVDIDEGEAARYVGKKELALARGEVQPTEPVVDQQRRFPGWREVIPDFKPYDPDTVTIGLSAELLAGIAQALGAEAGQVYLTARVKDGIDDGSPIIVRRASVVRDHREIALLMPIKGEKRANAELLARETVATEEPKGEVARLEEGKLAPTFPDGDFYSCTDPETLTHTCPEEALEEYLDADLNPKMTVAEVLASIRAHPITVTAYKPTEISDKQIEIWADALLEKLGEDFSEEHGDPDGGPCDAFPDDAEQVVREAVKNIIRRARVWACEDVGKVTLTPDQIEELMREHRPDWFDEESEADASQMP